MIDSYDASDYDFSPQPFDAALLQVFLTATYYPFKSTLNAMGVILTLHLTVYERVYFWSLSQMFKINILEEQLMLYT